MDRVEEIHLTKVHTSGSGEVKFPNWDRTNWEEELIEIIEDSEDDEFTTTYSIWRRKI